MDTNQRNLLYVEDVNPSAKTLFEGIGIPEERVSDIKKIVMDAFRGTDNRSTAISEISSKVQTSAEFAAAMITYGGLLTRLESIKSNPLEMLRMMAEASKKETD